MLLKHTNSTIFTNSKVDIANFVDLHKVIVS
jgi:hypothetical protein